MVSELIIRPGHNDHHVVADLLATSNVVPLRGHRPSISRLVLDATVARAHSEYGQIAEAAGIPLLVDPMTYLMQGPIDPQDAWAKLFFASAEQADPSELRRDAMRAFVEGVVEFQLEAGATAIVPPYFYAGSPDDAWLRRSIIALRMTRRYLDQQNLALPITAIACVKLQSFAPQAAWHAGVDRLTATCLDQGVNTLALCVSPVGKPTDSYHKIQSVFRLARHLNESGLPVIAWRLGSYGPALVAAGAAGYETGLGVGESVDVKAMTGRRKVKKPGGGGSFAGVYLDPLGRSVSRKVAEKLMTDMNLRAKLMCNDPSCCPHGVASTLDDRRQHTVRSRARELADLDGMPAEAWRLNHLATRLRGAVTVTEQANRFMRSEGHSKVFETTAFEGLHRVMEELRRAAAA